MSLSIKTFHGLKWSTLSTVLTAIMQIGYTAVMARLLDADDFGLVAMGGVALRFGSYFSNMGMTQALIQKKDLYESDIKAAFSFSVLLGGLFFLVLFELAPFLSIDFFKNEELIPIIRVLAISFILTSLSSTSLSLLRRALRFKVIALIEIIAFVFSYGVIGIGMAIYGFGVWSLVFASLGRGVITVIFSIVKAPHKILLSYKWKYYKPLFSYGSRISLINFLGFLTNNLDTMVIGRILGASLLGIYNRAYTIINLPVIFFTQSISKVLFPAMSSVQSNKEKLKNVFKTSISAVGFILFPACFGASVASEEIVMVVLGDKWVSSIPILSILAIATPFNLLTVFAGIICEVTAKLRAKIIFQSIFLGTMFLMFYLLHGYGLKGFAFSILVATFSNHIVYTTFIKKELKISFIEIIKIYLPGLLTSILAVGFIFIVKYLMEMLNTPLIIVFIAEVLIGILVLMGSILIPINKDVRNKILEYLPVSIKKSKIVNRILRLA